MSVPPQGWYTASPHVEPVWDNVTKRTGSACLRVDALPLHKVGDYVYRVYAVPSLLGLATHLSFYSRSTVIGEVARMHIDVANTGISSVRPYVHPIWVEQKNVWEEQRWDISEILALDPLRVGPGLVYAAFEVRDSAPCSFWIDDLRTAGFLGNGDPAGIASGGNQWARARLTLSMDH